MLKEVKLRLEVGANVGRHRVGDRDASNDTLLEKDDARRRGLEIRNFARLVIDTPLL